MPKVRQTVHSAQTRVRSDVLLGSTVGRLGPARNNWKRRRAVQAVNRESAFEYRKNLAANMQRGWLRGDWLSCCPIRCPESVFWDNLALSGVTERY